MGGRLGQRKPQMRYTDVRPTQDDRQIAYVLRLFVEAHETGQPLTPSVVRRAKEVL